MKTNEPTRAENLWAGLQRFFTRQSVEALKAPLSTDTLTPLYAAGITQEHNFLYRWFIQRSIPFIRLDETHLDTALLKANQGPLVYVTFNMGHLEYNIFGEILARSRLPVPLFNNTLHIRRWTPLKAIRRSYRERIAFLRRHGRFPDPLRDGYLQNLLEEGKSFCLSMDETNPAYLSTPHRQLLEKIIAVQNELQKPVTVIPIQLIWDKRPRRQRISWFETLFGENERPGNLRTLILFFRHTKNRAVVKLGEPVAVTDFLRLAEGERAQALHQKVLSLLQIEKRILTGPLLRPREWFLERVFEDEDLAKTLYGVAKERGKSVESVKRLAERYAREIAADVRYSRIEFGFSILDWLFRNLFDKVYVDAEGIKQLKKTLSRGPTVLAPNHRSHFDYLLISYLCYQHDIVVPLVAAGINLSFWPLGGFFRKCGAFFLRRSFQGNALYKKVFQTYLKVLIREGYLQEFFIEGGRSRSGKLRSPKMGMLSMYTECLHEEAAHDIQFVPVSITYDRVLEQTAYLKEVEGETKASEKTRDLLKLRKFLNRRYGNIYVHFGQSISWQGAANEFHEPQWERRKPEIVRLLADKICHDLNSNVVVVPQSLVAAALLVSPRRGITLERARDVFLDLLNYLKWKQVKMADLLLRNPEAAFFKATREFEKSGYLKLHQGLDESFFEVPIDKRLSLDFFKNSGLHYLVSLALGSSLLLTRKTGPFRMEGLAESYAYFQRLFHYEFRFSTRLSLNQHLDKLCCYLQEQRLIQYAQGEVTVLEEGRERLRSYSLLIRNYIEAYLVAWKTYLLRPIFPNDEKGLTKAMLEHGRHQLLLGVIEYPEAISRTIFENALHSFRELNLFSQESHLAKKLEDSLEKLKV